MNAYFPFPTRNGRFLLIQLLIIVMMTCSGSAVAQDDPGTALPPPGEIHQLLNRGKLDEARQLIEADPNRIDELEQISRWTPLHAIIAAGRVPMEKRLEMIAFLLDKGANIDASTACDWTPLHLAVTVSNNKPVVKFLLERGADPSRIDNEGETPLSLAKKRSLDTELFRLFENRPGNLPPGKKDPFPPLLMAAKDDDLAMAKQILAAGGNPRETSYLGKNALHYCRSRQMVELLVKAGADPKAVDLRGTGPAIGGDSDSLPALKALIEAGADVNCQSIDGWTPLLSACCQNNNLPLVKMLIAAGARVEVRDRDGRTPLHQAAQIGDSALVAFLIAQGAEPNAVDQKSATPIALAREFMPSPSHEEVIRILEARAGRPTTPPPATGPGAVERLSDALKAIIFTSAEPECFIPKSDRPLGPDGAPAPSHPQDLPLVVGELIVEDGLCWRPVEMNFQCLAEVNLGPRLQRIEALEEAGQVLVAESLSLTLLAQRMFEKPLLHVNLRLRMVAAADVQRVPQPLSSQDLTTILGSITFDDGSTTKKARGGNPVWLTNLRLEGTALMMMGYAWEFDRLFRLPQDFQNLSASSCLALSGVYHAIYFKHPIWKFDLVRREDPRAAVSFSLVNQIAKEISNQGGELLYLCPEGLHNGVPLGTKPCTVVARFSDGSQADDLLRALSGLSLPGIRVSAARKDESAGGDDPTVHSFILDLSTGSQAEGAPELVTSPNGKGSYSKGKTIPDEDAKRQRSLNLFKAIREGKSKLAVSLIEQGVNVESRNPSGMTLLMAAAHFGLEPVVQALLKANANGDAQNSHTGTTALMLATMKGHAGVVRLLSKARVDLQLTDKQGKTALMLAREKRLPQLAELLESLGALK